MLPVPPLKSSEKMVVWAEIGRKLRLAINRYQAMRGDEVGIVLGFLLGSHFRSMPGREERVAALVAMRPIGKTMEKGVDGSDASATAAQQDDESKPAENGGGGLGNDAEFERLEVVGEVAVVDSYPNALNVHCAQVRDRPQQIEAA